VTSSPLRRQEVTTNTSAFFSICYQSSLVYDSTIHHDLLRLSCVSGSTTLSLHCIRSRLSFFSTRQDEPQRHAHSLRPGNLGDPFVPSPETTSPSSASPRVSVSSSHSPTSPRSQRSPIAIGLHTTEDIFDPSSIAIPSLQHYTSAS
jgi:hypothetical protein